MGAARDAKDADMSEAAVQLTIGGAPAEKDGVITEI